MKVVVPLNSEYYHNVTNSPMGVGETIRTVCGKTVPLDEVRHYDEEHRVTPSFDRCPECEW